MSERAAQLARRLDEANAELARAIEACSDAAWRSQCPGEGWTAGVTAHHVAAAHPEVIGLVQVIAAGQPLPPFTQDILDQGNAEHARAASGCTRDETLALLRDSGAAAPKSSGSTRTSNSTVDGAAVLRTDDRAAEQPRMRRRARESAVSPDGRHLASIRSARLPSGVANTHGGRESYSRPPRSEPRRRRCTAPCRPEAATAPARTADRRHPGRCCPELIEVRLELALLRIGIRLRDSAVRDRIGEPLLLRVDERLPQRRAIDPVRLAATLAIVAPACCNSVCNCCGVMLSSVVTEPSMRPPPPKPAGRVPSAMAVSMPADGVPSRNEPARRALGDRRLDGGRGRAVAESTARRTTRAAAVRMPSWRRSLARWSPSTSSRRRLRRRSPPRRDP